jgi:anti-anti-sigma factor
MQQRTLECEVIKAGDHETGRVITVICHGQLVAGTAGKLKETMKPLIEDGGRIIIDFGDVSYVDSMGLGALVGIKVSAIAHGYCTVEFEHLSERIQELIKLTHLSDLFSK